MGITQPRSLKYLKRGLKTWQKTGIQTPSTESQMQCICKTKRGGKWEQLQLYHMDNLTHEIPEELRHIRKCLKLQNFATQYPYVEHWIQESPKQHEAKQVVKQPK